MNYILIPNDVTLFVRKGIVNIVAITNKYPVWKDYRFYIMWVVVIVVPNCVVVDTKVVNITKDVENGNQKELVFLVLIKNNIMVFKMFFIVLLLKNVIKICNVNINVLKIGKLVTNFVNGFVIVVLNFLICPKYKISGITVIINKHLTKMWVIVLPHEPTWNIVKYRMDKDDNTLDIVPKPNTFFF